MVKVLVHWVEMRTYEFPDGCPTDKYELESYIANLEDEVETYEIKSNSRDWEIVSIETTPNFSEDEDEEV